MARITNGNGSGYSGHLEINRELSLINAAPQEVLFVIDDKLSYFFVFHTSISYISIAMHNM